MEGAGEVGGNATLASTPPNKLGLSGSKPLSREGCEMIDVTTERSDRLETCLKRPGHAPPPACWSNSAKSSEAQVRTGLWSVTQSHSWLGLNVFVGHALMVIGYVFTYSCM